MKICVVGAGSLGCAIGGSLAEAGSEVWLVNRSQAHVDAINRDGLKVREGNGADARERFIRVHAAVTCDEVAASAGDVDLVIVVVKSFDTEIAVRAATCMVGRQTVVMSLQNGLGHEDILADIVGRERVVAGKSYVGGQLLGPGSIILGKRGKKTHIGELDGAITGRIGAIADEFNRAGLETEVSSNIMGTIWDKLLINVATGALSGITGLAYGELYKVAELEACGVAAVAEAMAVANASGIALSISNPRDAWLTAGGGLPADFKTSMLQSLEKGSITEIDYVNGSVVRWGRKCNVPTPVNETLVAGIKGIEARMRVDAATKHSRRDV